MMGWLRWKILSESEMSRCWLIYEWPWYWEHGSRWQSWYLYPVTSGNDHVMQGVPKTTKSYPAFTVWEILLVAKPLSLAIFWIHAQSSNKRHLVGSNFTCSQALRFPDTTLPVLLCVPSQGPKTTYTLSASWVYCSSHIIIWGLHSLKKQLLEVEWDGNGTAWRRSCSLRQLPADVIPTGRVGWKIQLLWQLSALLTSDLGFFSEGKEG